MELIMLPQPEDTRQIDGHPPMIEVEVRERSRSRKHWVVLAIVLIAVAALLASGIWSRVSASTTLRAETAQAALPAVSVASPRQPPPPRDAIPPGTVQTSITP